VYGFSVLDAKLRLHFNAFSVFLENCLALFSGSGILIVHAVFIVCLRKLL
jgi:hypothetical protein